MNPTKRHEIFSRLRAANPTPTTELAYKTDFQLLIAVMLSAQATDKSVNIATRKLFPRHGTPKTILALGVDGLMPFIQTIGLYKTKAKNVIATCALLLEQHAGKVPRTREALEALPGVGRKTANVVLNTAFGEPTIAVDTHIFRVSNRTKIARSGRRVWLREIYPCRVQGRCAPLADSARSLHLCCADTEMPTMRHFRLVRVL